SNAMSEAKKLNIGRELTDEELMEMTGGSTFSIQCQKDYTYKPSLPVVKYGVVIDEPEVVIKYGVGPIVGIKYGVEPIGPIQPMYGIKPVETLK
uniref:CtA n=1 Tax=Acetivibrio thermocellus (strain ATCC 27405 / DSM 1237 / JCM 9322 / NBRC 103400 / NCIMB 10682 / NRRL B-4536 / VPI 7372) TaxID=203119 RepID=UPI00135F183A|nr:Chain C, CtA [Acetivibrio thermocellus ATCC 27405]6V9Z_D Chain D, CtA [Acetivibrio thermocellus ATCC 27405]7T55_C Chain C, PCAT1 peptide substrate [Acetivibrio thermocellus]7T55_D Chain D, PCAT1 peptide substrate [Acetivibrio thermocellus]7T56_C Chain C, PCAT1 peptide substrate [Acetivibrio thermocellus]7T56_D Chain D, PCAT1 peptide substrate [Acetivibrio thermocellus]7T57_C Chain C, PCAT1 peptide substrate [Acetivibrio thermocellus]7T57_D Chain D, PCAT1 peptide substrate [Acetivibrio the